MLVVAIQHFWWWPFTCRPLHCRTGGHRLQHRQRQCSPISFQSQVVDLQERAENCWSTRPRGERTLCETVLRTGAQKCEQPTASTALSLLLYSTCRLPRYVRTTDWRSGPLSDDTFVQSSTASDLLQLLLKKTNETPKWVSALLTHTVRHWTFSGWKVLRNESYKLWLIFVIVNFFLEMAKLITFWLHLRSHCGRYFGHLIK